MGRIKRALEWPDPGLSKSDKARRVASRHGLDQGTASRLGVFCEWRLELMVALAVLGDASGRDPVELGRLVFGYRVPGR